MARLLEVDLVGELACLLDLGLVWARVEGSETVWVILMEAGFAS